MADIDPTESLKLLRGGKVPDWVDEHLQTYVQTNGEQGHMMDTAPFGGKGLTPCLILTTIGRRSGEKRSSPLIYGKVPRRGGSGHDYIIIGSRAGAAEHAHWYLNLLANPAVEVQVGAERFAARARIASGEERARLWAHMVDVYPPYVDYQSKTSREIPVIVLERS